MTLPVFLHDWAARWAIPSPALADLVQMMGVGDKPPEPHPHHPTSESYVQSLVVLEAPRYGVWLSRNNVGALQDKRGVPVRFGLANETKERNAIIKSGDLLGWRSIIIGPHHVGCRFAQFVSRECKKVTWSWGEDPERESAQLNWANLVNAAGGDAKFVQGYGSFT